MKRIVKKAALILAFMMICFVSYGALDVSAAEDFKDMGNRAISDVNKVWTLQFKTPVEVSSLSNNVTMQDITDGRTINVTISAGDDENLAKVNPPAEGYKMSHNYKLTVGKNAKSKKGESLPKPAVLNFTLTSKDNNDYNVLANVEVSPVISMFKKITIVNTNLPSVSKCKIEDGKNFFDTGKTIGFFATQNTLKVYLYDNKENLLGTSTLNVGSTQNNISMKVTLAN